MIQDVSIRWTVLAELSTGRFRLPYVGQGVCPLAELPAEAQNEASAAVAALSDYLDGAAEFDSFAELEPELRCVERNAIELAKHPESHGQFWLFWGSIKAAFSRVVGWHSRRPELHGTSQFEAVQDHLFRVFESHAQMAEFKREITQ